MSGMHRFGITLGTCRRHFTTPRSESPKLWRRSAARTRTAENTRRKKIGSTSKRRLLQWSKWSTELQHLPMVVANPTLNSVRVLKYYRYWYSVLCLFYLLIYWTNSIPRSSQCMCRQCACVVQRKRFCDLRRHTSCHTYKLYCNRDRKTGRRLTSSWLELLFQTIKPVPVKVVEGGIWPYRRYTRMQ